MATVELANVGMQFGSVRAVDDLSMRIENGEFISLLGPSGCGKTTTLNLLAGFLLPTSGSIRIGGQEMSQTPPHQRNLGVVFQSYALFPHMTVEENVAFGLNMRKVGRAETEQRVGRALDLVQLGSMGARFPKQLSGGQQQRVALARALVIEPSVLLLDEPLSNLDAALREQMRFEIREIQKRVNITTVFVTHDQNEGMAASDRIAVMKGGRIRQIGTPRDIYENPADVFVAGFLGQANLLDVLVSNTDGVAATVELSTGETVKVANDGRFPDASSVVLVLRPENLVLSAEETGHDNQIPARVKRVNYLGAELNIAVEAGGKTITVIQKQDKASFNEGQSVRLGWNADAAQLLPSGEA